MTSALRSSPRWRSIHFLHRQRRRLSLTVTRFCRNPTWGVLARLYTTLLTVPALFAGFWILFVLYSQLIDPKRTTLAVFPNGLNDATALVPVALAGFAALLFGAQQSVPIGRPRHQAYGRAGRYFLLAFFYLGTTFILGVGSRIMHPGTFSGWRWGWLFNEMAALLPGVMYINGLIALALITGGLLHFIRTISAPN